MKKSFLLAFLGLGLGITSLRAGTPAEADKALVEQMADLSFVGNDEAGRPCKVSVESKDWGHFVKITESRGLMQVFTLINYDYDNYQVQMSSKDNLLVLILDSPNTVKTDQGLRKSLVEDVLAIKRVNGNIRYVTITQEIKDPQSFRITTCIAN